MFGRITSMLVVLFAAAMLGACMSPVKNEVTTFHDNALPQGATVHVVALQKSKANTLEFEHYAQLVDDKLRQAGFQPVGSSEQAALLAEIDYSISDPETVVRTRPGTRMTPFYGPYYDPFWYGAYSPWYDPFNHGFYSDYPETYSYMQYQRELRLRIIDARASRNARPLYEGRVNSVGREQDIAEVMPYMVTALFENFPGESGVTRDVSISRND